MRRPSKLVRDSGRRLRRLLLRMLTYQPTTTLSLHTSTVHSPLETRPDADHAGHSVPLRLSLIDSVSSQMVPSFRSSHHRNLSLVITQAWDVMEVSHNSLSSTCTLLVSFQKNVSHTLPRTEMLHGVVFQEDVPTLLLSTRNTSVRITS